MADGSSPAVSFVVPTLDEAGNVAELVARVSAAVAGPTEIVFVDDSSDGTPDAVRAAHARQGLDVVLLHRERPRRWGGLGGAVVDGFRRARAPILCVMDADLQHPPETIPRLLAAAEAADLVIASRYLPGGSSSSGWYRRSASRVSTGVAKAVLDGSVHDVSDPLSGFFVVRKDALDIDALHPRGFKILLEILVRTPQLRVAEVGFEFGPRFAERSKASVREALNYVGHLAELRRAEGRPATVPAERNPVPREP